MMTTKQPQHGDPWDMACIAVIAYILPILVALCQTALAYTGSLKLAPGTLSGGMGCSKFNQFVLVAFSVNPDNFIKIHPQLVLIFYILFTHKGTHTYNKQPRN